MGNAIDLKRFLEVVKKRMPLILASSLLMVLIAGIVSYKVLTPTYEATTQLLVNQTSSSEQGFTAADIEANVQLISTYNIIIKSPAILSQVIDELGLEETTETLTERIEVSSVEGSQVVMINVQDKSMGTAVDIANATATIFQREIQNLMNADNVNILSPANIPAEPIPVKPNPLVNMTIGAIMGLLLGTGAAVMLDQLNTTVRTEDNAEEMGLIVLGVVSPIPKYKTMNNIGEEQDPYA
ncbi:YveK family protein [Planococcus lenghuensis]|uniref:Polysaccharide chain length determinant N-terminal domain-containing protein n=1 Tax=Planococcus lenghuensis TaxID=2213202 RepID=A0A1Q2L1E0_9BACL|nr:Wzz/FepE/Etk N-terminal domain-containing protein [Planococcus lenghuensis]AQQ54233.1 hypothetical protein B0X71_14760 [Planococcus lenghuensis]